MTMRSSGLLVCSIEYIKFSGRHFMPPISISSSGKSTQNDMIVLKNLNIGPDMSGQRFW